MSSTIMRQRSVLIAVVAAVALAISMVPFIGAQMQANADDTSVPDVVKAPLVDHGKTAAEDNETNVEPADYAVETTTGTDGTVNIAFTANGLPRHYNGGHMLAYWIGFGIPYVEGDAYAIDLETGDTVPVFGSDAYKTNNYTAEYTVGENKYRTFYAGGYNTLSARSFYVSVKHNDESTTLYKATFDNVKCAHDISIDDSITNGSVTVANEKANEGQEVAVTVEPSDGYELDRLTYTPSYISATTQGTVTEQEEAVSISDGKFTMPTGHDVTISATFKAMPKVTFVDEDGKTVLKEAEAYATGTKANDIKTPATPTKAADDEYTYEFAGWDPALGEVTGDATYKATYKKTAKKADEEKTDDGKTDEKTDEKADEGKTDGKTDEKTDEGKTDEGKDGEAEEPASDVAMHRLYNPNSGEHFYTSSDSERDGLMELGWQSEGDGWIAPSKSETPVYRLYNANGGEHHYTMNAEEKDGLVELGWSYEGIGWYSDDAEGQVLYRDYNPNAFANNHNYTVSKDEHDNLVALGWVFEGTAWYGMKVSD